MMWAFALAAGVSAGVTVSFAVMTRRLRRDTDRLLADTAALIVEAKRWTR